VKVSKFVREKLNEYKPIINILILEKENKYIYENMNKEIIIEQTKNIQFQLLELNEVFESGDESAFRVKLSNGRKGYFKPKNSVIFIPKKRQQVKISKDAVFKNSLNEHLDVDENNFEKNKNKIVFSSQYAIYNGEIYESLIYVDEIIGFVKSEEVNVLVGYMRPFNVKKNALIYHDSSMKKPANTLINHERSYESQYVILEENKVRFKISGKIYWVNRDETNLIIDLDSKKFKNLDELLIDTILVQINLKLENYHKYYQKLLLKHTKSRG